MTHLPLHTFDPLRADRLWLLMGGRIEPVRLIGERFYLHDMFVPPAHQRAAQRLSCQIAQPHQPAVEGECSQR